MSGTFKFLAVVLDSPEECEGKILISAEEGDVLEVDSGDDDGWVCARLKDDPTRKGYIRKENIEILEENGIEKFYDDQEDLESELEEEEMDEFGDPPSEPDEDPEDPELIPVIIPVSKESRDILNEGDLLEIQEEDADDVIELMEEEDQIGDLPDLLPKNRSTFRRTASFISRMEDLVSQKGILSEKGELDVDALTLETKNHIRGWISEAEEYILIGEIEEFKRIQVKIAVLLDLKRQVCNPKISSLSMMEKIKKIVSIIEFSRKASSGFILPRNSQGLSADVHNTPIIGLLRFHQELDNSNLSQENSIVEKNAKLRKNSLISRHLKEVSILKNDESRINDVHLPLQLSLNIKALLLAAGDPLEVHVSLFSLRSNLYLHEDYLIRLSKQGLPEDISLLNNLSAIFKDLKQSEIMEDKLVLVVRIYRIGMVKAKSSSSQPRKIPYGCSAIPLTQASILNFKTLEQEFEPYSTDASIYTVKEEELFAQLPDLILRQSKDIEVAPKSKGVSLTIQVFRGLYSDFISSFKSDVKPAICQRLQFTELNGMLDSRNDFYVFLHSGSFSSEGKRVPRNIIIELRIVTESGEVIHNCLSKGKQSGLNSDSLASSYRSSLFYRNNSPQWMETIIVSLPDLLFSQCHLQFLIYHISAKDWDEHVFSFAYLPLVTVDGTVIEDKEHILHCLPAFNNIVTDNKKAFYLRDFYQGQNSKDFLKIYTKLCSSTITQNDVLFSLFKWRQLASSELPELIEKIRLIEAFDLAKSLNDILNIVFSIMQCHYFKSNIDANVNYSAFLALMHVLDELANVNPKYQGIVENYLSHDFQFSDIHQSIMYSCRFLIGNALSKIPQGNVCNSQDIYLFCQVLPYVVRITSLSYRLDLMNAHPSKESKVYFHELSNLIIGTLDISLLDDDNFEKYMPILVRNLAKVFTNLVDVFSEDRLSELFCNCLKKILSYNEFTNSLNAEFLAMLYNFISQFLSNHDVIYQKSEPIIVKLIEKNLNAVQMNRLDIMAASIAVLRAALEHIHSRALQKSNRLSFDSMSVSSGSDNILSRSSYFEITRGNSSFSSKSEVDIDWTYRKTNLEVNISGLLPLLGPLIKLISFVFQSPISAQGISNYPQLAPLVSLRTDAFTCLNGMLFLISESDFRNHLNSILEFEGLPVLTSFIGEIFGIFSECLSDLSLLYPNAWIIMRLLTISTAISILRSLLPLIQTYYVPDEQLISTHMLYFDLCMSLLKKTDPDVELEKLKGNFGNVSISREVLKTRFLRYQESVLQNFTSLWDSLGSSQIHFMKYIIQIAVPNVLARCGDYGSTMSSRLYLGVLSVDYSLNKSLTQAERITFELLFRTTDASLDMAVTLFGHLKTQMFPKIVEMFQEGPSFVRKIESLYKLLCNLFQVPETEIYETERVSTTVGLIEFLDEVANSRKENLMHYIQRLVDIHLSLENYVEAGISLNLMIDRLDWSNSIVDSFGAWPKEQEMLRKERLCLQAINYFRIGEDWERMIEALEKLKIYYSTVIYDYPKVSSLLIEESKLYTTIIENDRFYSTFFRVAYYGEFENGLANEEFIFKGSKLESNIDFTNRMRKKYPNALIQLGANAASKDQLETHSQIIIITPVNPSSIEELEEHSSSISTGPVKSKISRIHGHVYKYLKQNNCKVFVFKAPVNKSEEPQPSNEFKDLWIVHTYLVTEDTFPSYRRRMQVVDKREVWKTPIENAIESVREKNKELEAKIQQTSGSMNEEGPLSMILNGMIDAAVNGGTKKYVDAFLCPEFAEKNPTLLASQKQLRHALRDQLQLLKLGLELFGQNCGDGLQKLHAHLSKSFTEMAIKYKQLLE